MYSGGAPGPRRQSRFLRFHFVAAVGGHPLLHHAARPVVTPRGVHDPACRINTDMGLHWSPFFDERISGSRFRVLFFVDGDAAISVASMMVPLRSNAPRDSRNSAAAANTAFVTRDAPGGAES